LPLKTKVIWKIQGRMLEAGIERTRGWLGDPGSIRPRQQELRKKEIGIAKLKIEPIYCLSTNACDVVPELCAPVGFPLK
jgi:hypothetical protein